MPKKRYNAEEIIHKLRETDVLLSQGKSVSPFEPPTTQNQFSRVPASLPEESSVSGYSLRCKV